MSVRKEIQSMVEEQRHCFAEHTKAIEALRESQRMIFRQNSQMCDCIVEACKLTKDLRDAVLKLEDFIFAVNKPLDRELFDQICHVFLDVDAYSIDLYRQLHGLELSGSSSTEEDNSDGSLTQSIYPEVEVTSEEIRKFLGDFESTSSTEDEGPSKPMPPEQLLRLII